MTTDPADARSSRRRKQRLTDYVVSKTNADIEVILTSAIQTAAVTSQSALEEGQELGLVEQDAIDQLQALAGGADAEYLMFITTRPANLDRLPFSDQLAADRMQQYGLALHESLHITYTDQHGVNRVRALKIDEEYHDAFHGFWNAGEDGAIERLARVNGGEKVEIRQTATHASLRQPASEAPPSPCRLTFVDAVMQAMIDWGIYDTGIIAAALDPRVREWGFRSRADRVAVIDILGELRALIARIQREPNSVARAEQMVKFWHDSIEPLISPDESRQQEGGMGGATGDTQEPGEAGGADAGEPSQSSTGKSSSSVEDGDETASGEVTVDDVMASPLSADTPDESADADDLAPNRPDETNTPREPPANSQGAVETSDADAESDPDGSQESAADPRPAHGADDHTDAASPSRGASATESESESESSPYADTDSEGDISGDSSSSTEPEEATDLDTESPSSCPAESATDPDTTDNPGESASDTTQDEEQYTLDAFTTDNESVPDTGTDSEPASDTDPEPESAPETNVEPGSESESDTEPDTQNRGDSPDESQPTTPPSQESPGDDGDTGAEVDDAPPTTDTAPRPSEATPGGDADPDGMTVAILEDADGEVADHNSRAEVDLNAEGPDESALIADIEDLCQGLEGGDVDLEDIEFMPTAETTVDPARWNTVQQDSQQLANVLNAALPDTDDAGYRHGTRSGKLSKRRLTGVPVGQTSVFRRRRQPEQKDYDIILILDRSSSMVYTTRVRERLGIDDDVPQPVELAEETVAAFALALEHPLIDANVAIVDFYDRTPRLIKPFATPTGVVQDSLMSSKAENGTPLTDVTDLATGWLTERGNDAIIITVTDGKAADVDAFQAAVGDTTIPVAGLTLSLHTDPDDPDPELEKNDECFDRHTFVYDAQGLADNLQRFAYDFIGLHTQTR